MSRIVSVQGGMSLLELQNNVAKEFFTFTDPAPLVVLSYWPPNTKELAIEITTPPIILTNYCKVDENPQPFATPNQPIKPNFNSFCPLSSVSSKIPIFSLFDEDELLQDTPLQQQDEKMPLMSGGPSPSTGPSKIYRFSV
ncbi:unnamed protein product [Brassica oleracea]